MQLAHMNVARLKFPKSDPRIADFVNGLDTVNALSEAAPGFVWRLREESAADVAAYGDPMIVPNLSVWTSPETLYEFSYRNLHREFLQRRREWFELFGAAHLALWWVADGVEPTVADGKERLEHIDRYGPTPWAFTFRSLFPPSLDARPLWNDEPKEARGR